MRISTGMIYDSGVRSVQDQTSTLLRSQQQIATGRRMLSPSEDPVAAARALEVNQAKEINTAYGKTQGDAKSTMGLVDSQLSSAADLLTRVRELAVQAGDASLSSSDLRSISSELRAHYDELIGLANSTDGTGQYLFAGFQGSNKPFAGSVESGVVYQGDDGQRALRVSSSRNLPVSDSGNSIFMDIKNGNGIFTTGAQTQRSANSNTITLDGTTVVNPPTVSGNLEMRFWVDKADVLGGGAGQAYYDLVDTSNGNSIFTGAPSTTGAAGSYTNAYSSGTPIAISDGAAFDFGVTAMITGSPQTGDIISFASNAGAVTATPKTLLPSAARTTIDKGQLDPLDPLAATKWSSAANSGNLELRFWTDPADASIYYDLVDANTGVSAFTGNPSATGAGGSYTQPYSAGSPISLASAGPPAFDFGATVTVSGLPATGDAFTIKSSTDITGNGSFVTSPKLAKTFNAGTGIIGAGEILDAAKWNNPANSGKLEVRFWNDTTTVPASQYYDLVDAKTEKSLFTDTASTSGGINNTYTHKFTSGDSIAFAGLAPAYKDFGVSVTIDGTPASGDSFAVNTSSSESAFSTIGRLIKALEAPDNPGNNAKIALHNELGSVINNLDRALDNNLVVRASIGSRLGEVDALDGVSQDLNLQYSATLSSLQDLDYAKAITDLTRGQTQLEAAQKSFVNISKLSLFNYV
ncbi:MAG: flagellar hook-associated protein FlgL [Proteobacteria bacterium]|nr:flagellar hook-associated protein FlgL [Pseudomonadota bacterium]